MTLANAACCRTAGHCDCSTGSAVAAQAAACVTAHHSVYEALQRQPPLLDEVVGHLELLHSILFRDWRHNDACRQCNRVACGSKSSVWQTQAALKGSQAQAVKTKDQAHPGSSLWLAASGPSQAML